MKGEILGENRKVNRHNKYSRKTKAFHHQPLSLPALLHWVSVNERIQRLNHSKLETPTFLLCQILISQKSSQQDNHLHFDACQFFKIQTKIFVEISNPSDSGGSVTVPPSPFYSPVLINPFHNIHAELSFLIFFPAKVSNVVLLM